MKWLDVGYFGLIFFVLVITQLESGCKGHIDSPEYDLGLDSVHLGIRLGMTRQDFFDHCWALNKSGQNITQGHHNTSVMHIDTNNFVYPVEINFYPEFTEKDIIYKLPVRFEYRPWAPWNREAHAEHLLPEVKAYIEKAYDVDLQNKTLESGQLLWYAFDTPRLITIYTENDRYVYVNFKNDQHKK